MLVADVSQADDELDDIAILETERAAKIVLRDHLEDVRVMRADRHDHRAIDVTDRRGDTLRAAERPSRRVEARDLDPGTLLEDLQLRKIRARDLQVQGAFVRFEPELLAELIFVPFLTHVKRAFMQSARDGSRDCKRFFDFKNPLAVGVFFPQHFSAAGGESDPLAARREVARDQSVSDQLEDPLGRALLTHANELAELSGSQVHVFFRPAEEGDRHQRFDVIRLPARGGAAARAYYVRSVTSRARRDVCGG